MSEIVHDHAGYSPNEMMIAAAARELAGTRVCFVGIGLPNIAVNLALHTVAPDLELIYEAGAYGAQPARLPLSIGDPTIVTGSLAVMSQADLFGLDLQRGLVDVGFLGAAQIDRFGNINTTVIGDYRTPRPRLPGSGGACEIAINARQVFVTSDCQSGPPEPEQSGYRQATPTENPAKITRADRKNVTEQVGEQVDPNPLHESEYHQADRE